MSSRILFKLSTLLMLAVSCGWAWGQPCAELPAAQSVSDQKGGCLALLPISEPVVGAPTLIVMLHGDGEGQLGPRQVDRWAAIGRTLTAPQRNVFFMVRPGYQSPIGHSSGWANPRDDDYTAENMARVAGAVAVLKQTYQARQLILVGHSGGAATAALILGLHPSTADAALLLACPCDVPPWRDHRNAQRGRGGPWAQSLNPLKYVSGIPARFPVIAVTGAQDDNTLPIFAKRWVEQAVAQGVKARYLEAAGLNHSTIQQWSEIPQRVNELMADLTK
jgi:predicted alpha/beta hydrolase family esterase